MDKVLRKVFSKTTSTDEYGENTQSLISKLITSLRNTCCNQRDDSDEEMLFIRDLFPQASGQVTLA